MVYGIPYSLGERHVARPELVAALRDVLCRQQRACIVDRFDVAVGMGKTQLALEYVLRFNDQYETVLWIRGSREATFTAEFSELASQLGLPEALQGDQPAMIRAVHEWLAHAEGWLIVVDDAADPQSLIPNLDSWGNGHVLITSRKKSWPDSVATIPAPPFVTAEVAALGTNPGEGAAAWWSAPLTADLAAAFCRMRELAPDRLAGLVQPRNESAGNDPTQTVLIETVGLHLSHLAKSNPAAGQLAIVCAHLDGGRIPIEVLRAERAFLPGPLRQRLDKEQDAYALFDALHATRLVQRGNSHLVMQPLTQDAVLRNLSSEKRERWALHVIRAVPVSYTHLRAHET